MTLKKIIIQKLFKDEYGCWHPVKCVGWPILIFMCLFVYAICSSFSIFEDAPPRIQSCCAEKCMTAHDIIGCKLDCIKFGLCR